MNPTFKKLNLQSNRPKTFYLKKFKLLFIVISVLIIIAIIWSFINTTSSVFNFAFATINPLKSTNNRVNILLLGNAGGKHDGPYLTDSIIIASYHLKSKKTTLISVPRDLWLDNTKTKVNTVYIYGQQKTGNGLKVAMDEIDNILGMPIHYGLRLDFRGFVKAVDLVGGVDVEVPKTFDDFNYPIEGKENDLCGLEEKEIELSKEEVDHLKTIDSKLPLNPIEGQENVEEGKPKRYKLLVNSQDKPATTSADFSCRFEHIQFEKGKLKMDGVTALKFVRSRMGTNGEGSDFARSRRQQIILQAFRGKVLSLETLINPGKIKGLLDTLGESYETDIPLERSLDFYKLIKSSENVSSIVLGDLGNGKSILVAPPASQYGAYVLTAPNNDFTSIKEFIKSKLDEDGLVVEEEKN